MIKMIIPSVMIGLLWFLFPGSLAAVESGERGEKKQERWTADIESGIVVPGYNNVQIPNTAEGTRFSLKNDLDIENKAYYRLRLTYRTGKRHALSLLFAPLSLDAGGVLPKPVDFEGVRFADGSRVNALYRFNSYRLTYRYRLVHNRTLDLWIGFTAKIRDAEVRIASADNVSTKTNVGFVPLLNIYFEWVWGKRTGFIFEADALAAKQGRAEDVSASLFYRVHKNIRCKFGYRVVEGGADAGEVYTFALINYFYGGVIFNF